MPPSATRDAQGPSSSPTAFRAPRPARLPIPQRPVAAGSDRNACHRRYSGAGALDDVLDLLGLLADTGPSHMPEGGQCQVAEIRYRPRAMHAVGNHHPHHFQSDDPELFIGGRQELLHRCSQVVGSRAFTSSRPPREMCVLVIVSDSPAMSAGVVPVLAGS